MYYSTFFGKTQKHVAQQFESKNHELLTKAGFIDQVASGIFILLPLGKMVLSNIEAIIREEMNAIGGQEILMPSLHPKALWTQTGRWDSVNILFKTKSRYGNEYGLGPTHEETVTPLAKKFIKSYRDLPLALYHITPKFRDEPRPKSGILRGREFGMKDLYSFHADADDLARYYKTVTEAYLKIFSRCGLKNVKITEASGGDFTKKLSHEFNIITPAGEVTLIHCNTCSFAQNEEIHTAPAESACPACKKGILQENRAVEIGNIFDIGTRFSEAFDLKFTDKDAVEHFPIMGCYGIGTTRLMGAVVEVSHDEKGIVWPESLAPFQMHLIGLDTKDESVISKTREVYTMLKEKNIAVLYDDREDISAGQKFADADLIGIPIRLVVSKKTGEKVEYKKRGENNITLMSVEDILSKF